MSESQDILHVELCTPNSLPIKMEAIEVIVPGRDGVLAVLPGHTPLLSITDVGVMVVYPVHGEPKYIAVNGGFIEVNNNSVLVLSHTAEPRDEIDLARAEQARERAEQRLKNSQEEDLDLFRTELALRRAIARIRAHHGEGY